jgi:hypothetical protein
MAPILMTLKSRYVIIVSAAVTALQFRVAVTGTPLFALDASMSYFFLSTNDMGDGTWMVVVYTNTESTFTGRFMKIYGNCIVGAITAVVGSDVNANAVTCTVSVL